MDDSIPAFDVDSTASLATDSNKMWGMRLTRAMSLRYAMAGTFTAAMGRWNPRSSAQASNAQSKMEAQNG